MLCRLYGGSELVEEQISIFCNPLTDAHWASGRLDRHTAAVALWRLPHHRAYGSIQWLDMVGLDAIVMKSQKGDYKIRRRICRSGCIPGHSSASDQALRLGEKEGPGQRNPDPPVHVFAASMTPMPLSTRRLQLSASFVGVLCKVVHESEECRRLADEQSHVRQELDYALGDVLCFVPPNDGTSRQLSTDERARLRHDQVGLKILAAKRRRIQVRKGDRHTGHWIHGSPRRRVARFVRPGLKVHGLGGTNADQDSQDLMMCCALRHCGIEAGAALFAGREMEARGIRHDLQEVGIAGVSVGPGNGCVFPCV